MLRSISSDLASGGRVLLVPLGSIEQHGPHLPLGTDGLIASTVCGDVARRRRGTDMGPLIPISASGEHEGFAGLLSIGTDVTASLLTELIRSARPTWRRIIIVSGHGGNAEALQTVCQTARREGDEVQAWMPSDPGGDAHAGGTETSFLLTIDPDLVGEIPDIEPVVDNWLPVARKQGIRAVSNSGVIGDPRSASIERGWSIRQRWCAEVVAMIDTERVAR